MGVKGLIDDYFQLVAKVQLRGHEKIRFGMDGAPLEIGTVKEKSSISDPCKSVSPYPDVFKILRRAFSSTGFNSYYRGFFHSILATSSIQ